MHILTPQEQQQPSSNGGTCLPNTNNTFFARATPTTTKSLASSSIWSNNHSKLFIILICIIILVQHHVQLVECQYSDDMQSYAINSPVAVVFDRLAPRGNPSETFAHEYLKLCPIASTTTSSITSSSTSSTTIPSLFDFGSEMTGGRRQLLNYKINFLETVQYRLLCRNTLSADDIERFRNAVERKFHMLLYIDGIPVLVPLGHANRDHSVWLYKHYHFQFKYNGDKVCNS